MTGSAHAAFVLAEAMREVARLAERDGVTLSAGAGVDGHYEALNAVSDETLNAMLAVLCRASARLSTNA